MPRERPQKQCSHIGPIGAPHLAPVTISAARSRTGAWATPPRGDVAGFSGPPPLPHQGGRTRRSFDLVHQAGQLSSALRTAQHLRPSPHPATRRCRAPTPWLCTGGRLAQRLSNLLRRGIPLAFKRHRHERWTAAGGPPSAHTCCGARRTARDLLMCRLAVERSSRRRRGRHSPWPP
jgi:hypothetical protein